MTKVEGEVANMFATPLKEKSMGFEVKDGLTKRQEIVLRYILRSIKERSYPPALWEIAKEIKIKSEAGAKRHIDALAKKGYIKKEKWVHRGIKPMEGVEDFLEGINQRRLFEEYQKGGAR